MKSLYSVEVGMWGSSDEGEQVKMEPFFPYLDKKITTEKNI